jgi:putative addiction module component (TIGR02574 family)
MPATARNIFEDALSLPAESRVDLVEKLLTSLNLPTKNNVEKLWKKELASRLEKIDKGEAVFVPEDEVFFKIRKKYKR